MLLFVSFFIVFAYVVHKNFYGRNKIFGKEVPKVPFLQAAWSVITGPHVDVITDLSDEYYQAGIYKVRIFYLFIYFFFKKKERSEFIKVIVVYICLHL
jgi:hypothetical protein